MVKAIDSELLKTELLGMQRWEDEGGQMTAGNDASPDALVVAPIHVRRHVASLRWDERFIIQPFRRDHGMILISENKQVNQRAIRIEEGKI